MSNDFTPTFVKDVKDLSPMPTSTPKERSDVHTDSQFSFILAKLFSFLIALKQRLSEHQLSLEVGRGRVPKVPWENRICKMCKMTTEFHFLQSATTTLTKRKFLDKLYSKFQKSEIFL